MELGVKRLIGDQSELFRFYDTHPIAVVERDAFFSWIESQRKHFIQKIELEAALGFRKEAFIVQEIFNREPGQDRAAPPKTVGGLILKTGAYKLPEGKGFAFDARYSVHVIEEAAAVLMKDVEALCRKEGYDAFRILANPRNHTVRPLVNLPGFQIEAVRGRDQDTEYLFRRDIKPIYYADPLNWLDRALWYLRTFLGITFDDLKYRSGHRLADLALPAIRRSDVFFASGVSKALEARSMRALVAIFDDSPTAAQIVTFLAGQGDYTFPIMIVRRKPDDAPSGVLIIDEREIDDADLAVWMAQ